MNGEMDIVLVLLSGGVGAAVVKLFDNLIQGILKLRAERRGERQVSNQELSNQLGQVHDAVEDMRTGLRNVLQVQIEELCVDAIQAGKISLPERERIVALHDCYHNKLHGNGNLDALMEAVMDLSII